MTRDPRPLAAGNKVMALDSIMDMPVTCEVIAIHDGWAWIVGPGVNRIEVESKLERVEQSAPRCSRCGEKAFPAMRVEERNMANRSVSFSLGGLPSLAFYLGVGALCHAVFMGAHFDWASAWTWGWLLGWPAMMFVTFWVFALILAALVMFGLGVAWVIEAIGNRRRAARRMKRSGAA